MTENRLVTLIIRKIFGGLTPEEALELEAWGNETEVDQKFSNRLSNQTLEQELKLWGKIDPIEGYSRMLAYLRMRRRFRIRHIGVWSAAATLLIAVALGGLIEHRNSTVQSAVVLRNQLIMPGKNTATLTLANGQQIMLDSVNKGTLTIQGASRVVKSDSGHLSYQVAGGQLASVAYNVLTTPKSGQYQLTLPDGSGVWMNNVSSLRYPTTFQGKVRTVELTGEAYFEIAKDAARPFIVKVNDEAVQVLGTHFNINAYADEPVIRTTLLEGSVRVETAPSPSTVGVKTTSDKLSVVLKPGQQAQLVVGVNTNNGSRIGTQLKVVSEVDVEGVVSWKDGFFYFGRASFAAVMRQLARWYDVDVIYEGKVPDMEFGGKIDRSLPLNDLLKFLDKNQIHFRLDGRKLIVLPN